MSTIGNVSGSFNDRSRSRLPANNGTTGRMCIPYHHTGFCLAGIIEPDNSEDNYTTTDDDNDSILSRKNCTKALHEQKVQYNNRL